MYRFLGPRIQDMIKENENIRDAQKKELDSVFAASPFDGDAQPLKLVRWISIFCFIGEFERMLGHSFSQDC